MPAIKISKDLEVKIEVVSIPRIFGLRHRILRNGLPLETACFEGDIDPHTHHIAACVVSRDGTSFGVAICCASFMLNSYMAVPAYQLRGMATDDDYRSRGLGGRLLTWSEEHLGKTGRADLLWCNAREPAIKFYEKNGWECVTDVFDIPTAGPHRKMIKSLKHRN